MSSRRCSRTIETGVSQWRSRTTKTVARAAFPHRSNCGEGLLEEALSSSLSSAKEKRYWTLRTCHRIGPCLAGSIFFGGFLGPLAETGEIGNALRIS